MRRRTASKILSALAAGALTATMLVIGTGSASAAPVKPPKNVQVTEVTPSTATVEWDPPSGHSGDWYRVMISRGWERDFAFVNGTSHTFENLYAGETYEVQVEVWFSAQWSDPVEFTTVDVLPPPTPANVTATTGPGTVTLEWDPSIRDGEEADYYFVRWTPDSGKVWVTGTSITREIPSGAELSVTVAAFDADFWRESEPSEPLEITVPPAEGWDELSAPTNLRLNTDGNVVESIEWDAAEGGADPVTYKINYHFGDQGPNQSAVIAEAGTATVIDASVIADLFVCEPNANPGQQWVIWVTAHSSGITSPPSNTELVCIS